MRSIPKKKMFPQCNNNHPHHRTMSVSLEDVCAALGRNDTLAKTTTRSYCQYLRRLCHHNRQVDMVALLTDSDAFKAFLETVAEPGTRKQYLTVAVAALKHCEALAAVVPEASQQLLRTLMMDQASACHNRAMQNKPRAKLQTAAGLLTWDVVAAGVAKLAETAYGSPEHMLLALYTEIEPRRLEYASMVYLAAPPGEDEDRNCVWRVGADGYRMQLNEYKTAKRYGRYDMELPPSLAAILHHYLAHHGRPMDGTPLFTRPCKRDAYDASAFGHWLSSTLLAATGHKLSLNDMRHMYISAKLADTNLTTADKHRISLAMGHNLAMQETYRIVDTSSPPPAPPPTPAPPPPPTVAEAWVAVIASLEALLAMLKQV